ncbi:MAG: VLRF1 family aeRF1-type release factor [Candidatus Acidiferrales bacterium]
MQTLDPLTFVRLPQPVLTIYLDTNPAERDNQRKAPGYLTWLKDEAKSVGADVPVRERRLFREQLSRVEHFLRDQTSHQRGLLIFAGPATWETVNLEIPVRNELHWGKPCVSQLLGIMDEQKPCCIVAVDQAGARFFRFHLGEMAEFPELKFRIDVSQWKEKDHAHMAQRRTRMPHGPQRDAFKSRVNDEFRHFFVKVAEKTRNLCAKEGLCSIFLIGSARLTEPIEFQLPRQLRDRVACINEDLARVTISDLNAHLTPLIEAREKELIKQRVDDLLDGRHGTVVGLDETLAQLQNGTVSTLMLVRGLDARLRQCVKCGLASRSADPVCVSCGGARERAMLSEALPELARANRAEIEVVNTEAAAKLITSGGIGGWLRQRRQTRETSHTHVGP